VNSLVIRIDRNRGPLLDKLPCSCFDRLTQRGENMRQEKLARIGPLPGFSMMSSSWRRSGWVDPCDCNAAANAQRRASWSWKSGLTRVPEATHKVGESTVEVGSHYFAKVLGWSLTWPVVICRRWAPPLLPRGDNSRIEERLEIGGSDFPASPSFQLDRGRLENYLAEHCQSLGITFLATATVSAVEFARGRAPHQVTFVHGGGTQTVTARWVVDASGAPPCSSASLS